jgi:hypothetical protein
VKSKHLEVRVLIGIGISCILPVAAPLVVADTSVHVGIHRHLHQPNYWGEPATTAGRPNQSQYGQDSQALKDANQAYYGDTIQHPEVLLVGGNDSVFGNNDKQQAYQANIKKSIGAMTSADAGMTISYSGALQRNLWSFGRYSQAGYTPGWNADNVTAYGWKTSGGVNSRAQVLGQTYHHAFTPLLPESALRKEIEMQKERTRKSWGLASDLSDQPKGFWPIELAFSQHLIPILVEYGYQWVMIPNSHLARTCPNYMDALAQPNPGAELKADPPNRADQLGPTVPLNQWYGANRDTYGNVFPVPFAYQLHKAKYVNPTTGAETKMTVVPQCDYHGYQSGYGTVGWDHIDGKIAQHNDPNQPALVMLTNDGENFWGGGNSFWNEFAPNFMNEAPSHGKKAITIGDFVAAHPAPENDVVHVEDGSWLAADQGSPQFYRWLEPPRRISGINWADPNSIFDLENGWHSDMRNWAVMLAGVNHCETAEQIFEDGGGQVLSWRIEEPYQDNGTSNNPNAAEQAWHFLLWGFDSGFMYFGDTLDDEVKHTVAANRAISIAASVIGDASADDTPPVVFKPQRFPWNPGGKGKGQYLGGLTTGGATVGFTTPPWSSDFYIWTLVYDVSGIQNITLKIRVDADGANPLNDNANETYAGGTGVGSWISIPMTRRSMPKNDPTGNANLNFFVLPNQISDYCWAKVTGYRGALLDYYVESTDSRGNLAKSDIQHVYVEDDGTTGEVQPSATFTPATPSDCAPITVNFNAATSVLATASTVNAFYHFSTNTNDWVTSAMTRTSTNAFSLTFATNQIPNNAPQLEVAFNDGVNWESNGGANWKVAIRDCEAPAFSNGVSLNPGIPTAGQSVTVTYDPTGRPLSAATSVNIHYGYNGANWTTVPGVPMTKSGSFWTYAYTISVAATNIAMVFNTVIGTSTNWDNNGGQDWKFAVNPAQITVPNGVVITNPAVGTVTVANAVSSYLLRGTAGTNLMGDLAVTNSGSGLVETFLRAESWSRAVSLAVGDNVITVFAQVAPSGTTTSAATVTIVREAPVIPVPDGVVITNPAVGTATVANVVTNYTLRGTAGTNLTGNLMWTNTLTGLGGSFTRQTYWNVALGLDVGDNPISISGMIAGTGAGAATNASDSATNAAYSGGWANGSNGGTGFGAWVLANDANAGHKVDAKGWGLWSREGGNLAEAARPFSAQLATGQTFRVRMQNGDIANGASVGIQVRNGSGNLIWEIFFIGGESFYKTPAGPTDIGWTSNGLDVAFTLAFPGSYSVEVQPVGNTARQYGGTFVGEATQFRAWSYNNGASDGQNSNRDFFINNVLVTSPASGGGESYSTAMVHILREPNGGNPPPVISDIGVVASNGTLQVSITNSIPGAEYALYSSPTLTPTQNWLVVPGTVQFGNGGDLELAITNFLAVLNYYRAGYVPPPL